ncbi:ATP-dependent Lon protease pim1 [Serendipita sp. 399]|nr:ATP-dependent Lon protease pim1 [Serendipita sp. 399]
MDKSGVVAACKVIAMDRNTPEKEKKVVTKEIQVHSTLVHENIIRLKDALLVPDDGQTKYNPGAYLLMEMAHGGDLFDKIAPDVGVEDDLAHYYMEQLMAGLSYIHDQGVCHRDLKPENLLLSIDGVLKLCDFGLCAVFQYKGSLAYDGAYDAPPIDVWGSGIILFTLLLGTTPWDEATVSSPEFMAYVNGSIWTQHPWSTVSQAAKSPNPADRPTIGDVKGHPWFLRQSQFATQSTGDMALHLTKSLRDTGDMDIAQPDTFMDADGDHVMATAPGTAFTQSLQFFTQLPSGLRHSPHLTRFFVSLSADMISPLLLQALQSMGIKTKRLSPSSIILGGVDSRRERYKGRISIEQFVWREDLCCFIEMAREEHAFPTPSHSLSYPRWLNKAKQSKAAADTQDTSHDRLDTVSAQPAASKDQVALKDSEDEPPASSSSGSSSSAPPSSDDSDDSGSQGSPPSFGDGSSTESSAISKLSVPENYPQVLALPIARRPLFPGFYKAVIVKDPAVVAAMKDMLERGQPYIGAFLLKAGEGDSDTITDLDSVHKIGVFAQITSVFPASGSKDDKDGALTVVLYPHRRIKITDLVPRRGKNAPSTVNVAEVEKEDATTALETEASQAASSPFSLQTQFLHDHDISLVNVDNMTSQPYDKNNHYIRAVMSEIVSVFKDIAQMNPLFRDQITAFSASQLAASVFEEPDKLADFAAAVSTGEVGELQDVLESMVIEDRLQKALVVLKKELINAQLQSKISRDVDSKIAKRQREYYLMEQLKMIKKELGMESDGKDKLIEKFKERANSLRMPDVARKVFEEELNKLVHLEPAASEFNVTRNYLDWLTQIPWGQHTPENFSIQHAVKVLDEDHYGLKDVKDRILEFLAVGKLRGTVEGKIICFVGPPGVGKTSIGKSIARALNRQFFRFSVGGLTDVAEIKGHRRTYVGALPSKIIQALKRVGTENPLIMIDEVDKIGRGHNGDPASALLEMLDPEQNTAFLDHYMDVPIDLSRVLFVCTANNLDTIPAPLLDRMEVLEVSGYVSEEKAVIADKYLAPQAKESSGLKNADVTVDPEAIDVLIKYYCRESGVRNLKKHIEKIYRKAALKIVQDLGEEVFPEETTQDKKEVAPTQEPASSSGEVVPESATVSSTQEGEEEKTVTTEPRKPLDVPETVHVKITPENLKDYVGPPVYHRDRFYIAPPPAGVSTGLGYLGNGSGAVMPIEATSMPGKGGLQLTGKLGEVIRESAQIALSWAKSHAVELGITSSTTEQVLSERDIHVHMPEGSIGKEGPSAGTALLTAFVSLLTKTKVSPEIAMTGEITLVGQVLPVGGLKEKILAAHRAGIKKILAPAANQADIEENVPESVKTGIEFVYVENVLQVLHEVFKGTDLQEKLKSTLPLEQ